MAEDKNNNRKLRIENKIEKIKKLLKKDNFYKLILLDNDKLIEFISIF